MTKQPIRLALAALLLASTASAQPLAPKKPHVATVHGQKRVDEYFWLRNKGTKEVDAYLRAEAAYADAQMKPTEKLQETLYNELLSRIKEDDDTPPFRNRGYFYYVKTVKGKQHPILCRRAKSLDGAEEIMLDVNVLGAKEKYIRLGQWWMSDDANKLAYTVDVTGFREFTLFVKDLKTGALGPEKITHVTSFAWAADNQTLFYTTEDQAKRSYRLYRHGAADELIYEEKDEHFSVNVDRSRSLTYLFMTSSSLTSSEVRYLDANTPTGAWKMIAPREREHEYYVDHRGDSFYIRTNKGGRNFRVVTAKVGDSAWKELLPHRANVMVEDLNVFANHLVVTEREDGVPQLRITDLKSGAFHRIAMPESVYEVFPGPNPEFEATTLRFLYTSFITPMSTFDYDMDKKTRKLIKEQPVLGGYDRTRYAVERIHADAPDGTAIPISLVYKKGIARDGHGPMLLEGYGAYGYPYQTMFSSHLVSLLDRGVAFAVAHIRGGGELGKRWHDAGRMFNKRNTFSDFIAAAEHLVSQKYTEPTHLVIEGRSAGGLLMGAVLNMRPDLFSAALVGVPFVDVINTMLDESLPLTVGEFEEWGNPKIQEQYHYMMSYSPYDNLAKRAYPTILVKSSYNDSQVMYWEPAKWVARLRTLKTDKNPLIFKIDMDPAGHGGKSGRYERLHELAFDYAFFLTRLGLEK